MISLPGFQDGAVGHGFGQVLVGQAVLQADGARAHEDLVGAHFRQGLLGDVADEGEFALAQHPAQADDRNPLGSGQGIDHRQGIGEHRQIPAPAQGAGSFKDGCPRAEEDRLPGLDERRGGLSDADFFVRLFVLALQDGLFGRGLGQDDRAAMDALELALAGEVFQVTPGGGLTDIERGANFRHADALLAFQQLQDLVLAVSA